MRFQKKGWDSPERSETGSGHKKTPRYREGLYIHLEFNFCLNGI
jgi:hypothetical protein